MQTYKIQQPKTTARENFQLMNDSLGYKSSAWTLGNRPLCIDHQSILHEYASFYILLHSQTYLHSTHTTNTHTTYTISSMMLNVCVAPVRKTKAN